MCAQSSRKLFGVQSHHGLYHSSEVFAINKFIDFDIHRDVVLDDALLPNHMQKHKTIGFSRCALRQQSANPRKMVQMRGHVLLVMRGGRGEICNAV